MDKIYKSGMRPIAIDHVFFNEVRSKPSFGSIFAKGVYWGLLSCSVATLNPKYAFFYGFTRGSIDLLAAEVQYNVIFEPNKNNDIFDRLPHECITRFNNSSIKKTIYCALNIFISMLAVYLTCKIGELVYWGGQLLIGRVHYRPFGILELIKIESVITLFTAIDIGLRHLDSYRYKPRKYCER